MATSRNSLFRREVARAERICANSTVSTKARKFARKMDL